MPPHAPVKLVPTLGETGRRECAGHRGEAPCPLRWLEQAAQVPHAYSHQSPTMAVFGVQDEWGSDGARRWGENGKKSLLFPLQPLRAAFPSPTAFRKKAWSVWDLGVRRTQGGTKALVGSDATLHPGSSPVGGAFFPAPHPPWILAAIYYAIPVPSYVCPDIHIPACVVERASSFPARERRTLGHVWREVLRFSLGSSPQPPRALFSASPASSWALEVSFRSPLPRGENAPSLPGIWGKP